MRTTIVFLVLLAVASIALANGDEGADPIGELLISPELVMRYQTDIALADAAGEAIRLEVASAQDVLLDLQWQLEREVRAMVELLRVHVLDEDAVLAQADAVMELERQIKRRHLAMLVRIRNQLTQEQRAALRELRDRDLPGPGGR